MSGCVIGNYFSQCDGSNAGKSESSARQFRRSGEQLTLQLIQQHLDRIQPLLRIIELQQVDLVGLSERQQIRQLITQSLLAIGMCAHVQRGHHRVFGQGLEQGQQVGVLLFSARARSSSSPCTSATSNWSFCTSASRTRKRRPPSTRMPSRPLSCCLKSRISASQPISA